MIKTFVKQNQLGTVKPFNLKIFEEMDDYSLMSLISNILKKKEEKEYFCFNKCIRGNQ